MEFKYRIRDLRNESGLSGQQLANTIQLPPPRKPLTRHAVSAWENGHSFPEVDTCIKLCKIFDCSMDYLLGLSDNRHGDVGLSKDESELIETVRKLRPEQAKEVSDFALFLQKKEKED